MTARDKNARCFVFRNLEHLLTQSVITIVRDSELKRLTIPYRFVTSNAVGIELLKSAPNDLLQKWPVSKRVNSSRADDNDQTLIEKVELAAA